MKKRVLRKIAIFLILALSLQIGVSAYVYPNDWSHDALVFAVENGILKGTGGQNLEPKRSTTRVEMAAILVRLLKLNSSADLSGYRDVSTTAWYAKELSAAVSSGIFNGVSATEMQPNSSITREQAMTVLCRAFGLTPWEQTAYTNYSDAKQISAYAQDAVSAMQERGLVRGYGDGSLRPRNSITRAEVAQLIYNLFDAIVDNPKLMPSSGRVLYIGSEPLPNELVLDGSLVLSANYTGKIGNWNIRDELVLRCTRTNLDLSGVTANSVTCLVANAAITGSPNTKRLVLWANDLQINCPIDTLVVVNGTAQVNGAVKQLEIRSGTATLNGSTKTATLAGGSLILNGSADTITVSGNGSKLTGSGYAGTVVKTCSSATITISYGNMNESRNYGLEGVSLSLSEPVKVTQSGQTVTLTATCKGGTFTGSDCVNGKLPCTLQWLQGGKVVSENTNFNVYNGATASYTFTITKDSATALTVRVIHGSKTLESSKTVTVDINNQSLTAVRTAQVEAWAHTDTSLYANQSLTSELRKLPKGTVVYVEYNDTLGRIKVTTKDGTVGWVRESKFYISGDQFTNSSVDFTTAVKENYVNKSGYTSKTSYLLWVSRYTQRVNVFQGSKGNWKLIKTFLVSTGSNITPTPAGTYATYYHEAQWDYANYYVSPVTGFYNGHAFHSILKSYGGGFYDSRVGIPLSHGCIRMLQADCDYIYSLPMQTTVVVY